MMRTAGLLAACALVALTMTAQAHITFENKEIAPGATVKLVLRVPHGCDGSPTTRVRVQLPEVLHGAKPQPKAGWDVAIVRPDAVVHQASTGHAHGGAAEAREVSWSGRLDDAYYDEFVLRVTLDANAPAGPLYVPIVQECESGVERWIELPPPGGSSDSLAFPAPTIRVTPRT